MTKHIVIPDCQVKPEHNTNYLKAIGNYIVDQQPEVVVCIGDFADMPSLSSYDIGKKSFEGRRYRNDIEATHEAMATLLGPLQQYNKRAARNHRTRYNPRLVLTLGNHEDRISRTVESDARLEGTIGLDDLRYADFGWEVHPYLRPVVIDGICYAHFFTSGILGRPVVSARSLVQKKHMSCTMGHVQNWEIYREVRADGQPVLGLFSGACYEHCEDYLGPQGNHYDRGLWVKHEVNNGSYHPMYVSLDFIKRKYA